MNLWVLYNAGNFLTTRGTVSFLGRTLFHGLSRIRFIGVRYFFKSLFTTKNVSCTQKSVSRSIFSSFPLLIEEGFSPYLSQISSNQIRTPWRRGALVPHKYNHEDRNGLRRHIICNYVTARVWTCSQETYRSVTSHGLRSTSGTWSRAARHQHLRTWLPFLCDSV